MAIAVVVRIVGAMMTKTEATRRGSGDGRVLGAMLVVLGVGWLLNQAGVPRVDWRALLSLLLVTLGAGMVLTARRAGGRLVVLGVILTVILAASSSTPKFDFKWNRNFHQSGTLVLAPDELLEGKDYEARQAAGDIKLDLRKVAPFTGTRTVKARLDAGDLTIHLPSTVKVSVTAHASIGEVHVLGRPVRQGFSSEQTYKDQGFDDAEQKLVVDADVSVGQITIVRDPAG
jgi:hypothetical protein